MCWRERAAREESLCSAGVQSFPAWWVAAASRQTGARSSCPSSIHPGHPPRSRQGAGGTGCKSQRCQVGRRRCDGEAQRAAPSQMCGGDGMAKWVQCLMVDWGAKGPSPPWPSVLWPWGLTPGRRQGCRKLLVAGSGCLLLPSTREFAAEKVMCHCGISPGAVFFPLCTLVLTHQPAKMVPLIRSSTGSAFCCLRLRGEKQQEQNLVPPERGHR